MTWAAVRKGKWSIFNLSVLSFSKKLNWEACKMNRVIEITFLERENKIFRA